MPDKESANESIKESIPCVSSFLPCPNCDGNGQCDFPCQCGLQTIKQEEESANHG